LTEDKKNLKMSPPYKEKTSKKLNTREKEKKMAGRPISGKKIPQRTKKISSVRKLEESRLVGCGGGLRLCKRGKTTPKKKENCRLRQQ